jgi:CheY-like chemotaxis protein
VADPKNILVVDDNPEMLQFMSTMIPALGHKVFTATDGEKGLARIRELMPDLICLDVEMPKKTGIEVLIEMRRDPAIAGIPVVMVTAVKFDVSFPEIMADYPNVRGFLGKPFTPVELANALAKAFAAPVDEAPQGQRYGSILVAEDDAGFRKQIEEALSRSSRVSMAQDGAQAIDFMKKTVPELVVLDAMMPRCTGIEVLRAMRQDGVRSRVPALLMTDFALKADDVKMLKAEFPNLRDVLQKPLTAESLRSAIENLSK